MQHTTPPLFKAHPWHGISTGEHAPEIVNAFIEIVPTDVVKYEVDKASGHLKIDRPQKYSNQCPTLYGFIPQTYCGKGVGELASQKSKRALKGGDRDPLDICVLSERPITRGGILLSAVPIGGFAMIDKDEADDKIIAVLHEDPAYGSWKDLSECPQPLLDRLRHYFLTYKTLPGDTKSVVEIVSIYGREEACRVIAASQSDYREEISHSSSAQTAP